MSRMLCRYLVGGIFVAIALAGHLAPANATKAVDKEEREAERRRQVKKHLQAGRADAVFTVNDNFSGVDVVDEATLQQLIEEGDAHLEDAVTRIWRPGTGGVVAHDHDLADAAELIALVHEAKELVLPGQPTAAGASRNSVVRADEADAWRIEAGSYGDKVYQDFIMIPRVIGARLATGESDKLELVFRNGAEFAEHIFKQELSKGKGKHQKKVKSGPVPVYDRSIVTYAQPSSIVKGLVHEATFFVNLQTGQCTEMNSDGDRALGIRVGDHEIRDMRQRRAAGRPYQHTHSIYSNVYQPNGNMQLFKLSPTQLVLRTGDHSSEIFSTHRGGSRTLKRP